MSDPRTVIAARVARELADGDLVNLGIGLPTVVADHLPPGIQVTFQSENGIVGMGPSPEPGKEDRDVFNAGGRPVTILRGGAVFDSALSFGIIRGGHVDVTVLGALEVDEEGSLASWSIPGKFTPGIGGAMDLVVGARKVVVAMEHTTKTGASRFLRRCTLPLTARGRVNLLVTELAVFRFDGSGPHLIELQPGATLEDVCRKTEARFEVALDSRTLQSRTTIAAIRPAAAAREVA